MAASAKDYMDLKALMITLPELTRDNFYVWKKQLEIIQYSERWIARAGDILKKDIAHIDTHAADTEHKRANMPEI